MKKNPEKSNSTVGIVELGDKLKSSEGSGMEPDQTEQLDLPLDQSTKELNGKCDTE